MVSHAILDTQHNPGAVPSNGEDRYQMFDFCKKSIQNVKDFLQQYCEGRRLAGYIMYQDPLAMFYEAVCVGIDFNGNVNADYFQLPLPPTVSVQRERAGKMTLADVGGYFHLPIEKASERLHLCPTVVKKICRKGGVGRWPYRKIQCIERKILELREQLKREDEPKRSRTQAEIDEWQRNLDKIRYGVARTD
ncbi:hypothetical protein EUGRSUZ_J00345 [Eucalyptus grandis]|uniref:Uncharacterized protein n=2 Tax=Eucalyptus grandis TaxID=71139 RepID=A0ACC3J1X5_EUCGR|nr:hypothetical protein EUGRSUZ_J00345 [Eucalyptus grandis]